jgi:hypothetical protein
MWCILYRIGSVYASSAIFITSCIQDVCTAPYHRPMLWNSRCQSLWHIAFSAAFRGA